MASGGSRVYPTHDMVLQRPFGTGGHSLSRQSNQEMFSQMESSKPSKSISLQQAYWTQKRRKIGLNRSPKQPVSIQEDEYLKLREQQITFVKEHFHQKECSLFIPVSGQTGNGKKCKVKDLKCHCGESLHMHAGMRLRNIAHIENCFLVPSEYASIFKNPEAEISEPLPVCNKIWSPEECVTFSKTNAFGKITFNVEQVGGKKPAKYVRLSTEDSVDDCLKLMQDFWRIMDPEPPHLVISVIGGAKNFKLDGRMRETFSTGLIKAAKSTSAWLLTSGFNMGIMKGVGQAVHEGQTFKWDNDRMTHVLRCIGIAPWGYVKGRQFLESPNFGGKWNAYYRTSNQILHQQPVPLNPDHTHFIFVDDGYRIKYQGVSEFRSKFEKKICSSEQEGGLGIPVVVIVVEGGTDAIQDVLASINQGIPVVICAGSGRAADILAYAYNHTTTLHSSKERVINEFHQDKLAKKIYAAYKKNLKPNREKEDMERLLQNVMNCCKREDLITVFNINKHEDLDLAILSVLLKVETRSSRESQLKLAMTWDRADIAQEEIFREDVTWQEGVLEKLLTEALVNDKVEFVKLFMKNGIVMREYLTVDRLEKLYNEIPHHHYLKNILKVFSKTDYFTISVIGNFLESILDTYDDEKYLPNQKENSTRSPTAASQRNSSLRRRFIETDTENEDELNTFKRPYKQLLVWAVLMNRQDLALLFWELGEEPIASAVIMTRICKEVVLRLSKFQIVMKESFNGLKNTFEQRAMEVLDECYSTDPEKALMIIERRSPSWSKMTSLQIAASATDQAFLSSAACQSSINNVWKCEIASRWPKVALGMFFPPVMPLLVKFRDVSSAPSSRLQKMVTFFTAPVTKFGYYSFYYLLFLSLFSYMLIVDFSRRPSPLECFLFVWVCSYIIGAAHSVIASPAPTLKANIRDYLSFLERFEAANLILAFTAFIIRWWYPYEAKVVYCVNIICFYVVILKVYTANSQLGPKIYMIYRMMSELGMFLMVLVVFLLAYGAGSQGLLYKHRSKTWTILKDVVYYPYWQLYGEIFLEEIETDDVCTNKLLDQYNGTLADYNNTCRTYHWLVPILLTIYLLIGNVLLLNLLIAIFSHVFETVEKKSLEIWKFQMYFLVAEFVNRPTLPPPMCLISYIIYLLRWLANLCGCCKTKENSEQYMKHHMEYLSLFEKEMMANRLRINKVAEMQTTEMKFSALNQRLDDLSRLIDDELLAQQGNIGVPVGTDLFAEFGLKSPLPEKIDEAQKNPHGEKFNFQEIEQAKEEEDKEGERKKHKHKKKKKKSKHEKKVNEELRSRDDNLNNINEPEEIKKSNTDKRASFSEDDNTYPALKKKKPDLKLQIQSPTPTPTVQTMSPTLPTRPTLFSHSSQYLIRNHELAKQQNQFLQEVSDSDEEEIPLEIYSPRSVPNICGISGNGLSPHDSDDSDVSGFSNSRMPRQRKIRKHLQRRRRPENEDIQDRLERVNRNRKNNFFSSGSLF